MDEQRLEELSGWSPRGPWDHGEDEVEECVDEIRRLREERKRILTILGDLARKVDIDEGLMIKETQ